MSRVSYSSENSDHAVANGTEMCVGELGEKPWRFLWRRLSIWAVSRIASWAVCERILTGQVAEREHCARRTPGKSFSESLSKEVYRLNLKRSRNNLKNFVLPRIGGEAPLVSTRGRARRWKVHWICGPPLWHYPQNSRNKKREAYSSFEKPEVGCPKP